MATHRSAILSALCIDSAKDDITDETECWRSGNATFFEEEFAVIDWFSSILIKT